MAIAARRAALRTGLLLGGLSLQLGGAGPARATSAQAGAAGLQVILEDWHDAARNRALPVKVYAPQRRAGAPAPAIVFSHGLGGSREAGLEWLAHWASHGYLCVALQHVGSDERWLIGEDGVSRLRQLRRAMNFEEFVARIHDVNFAVAELARRHAAGQARWAGVDATRIGLAGHSFGARTAMAMAGERLGVQLPRPDPRLSAFIAMSPSATGDDSDLARRFGSIRQPVLNLTGTRDRDIAGTGAGPQSRLLPFQHMAGPDKYLVVLDGANHMTFNGNPNTRFGQLARDPEYYSAIKAVTLAFWNRYLLGDAASGEWLRRGDAARLLGATGTLSTKP